MTRFKRILYNAAATLTLAAGLLVAPLSQHVAASTSSDEVCAGIAAASGTGCNGSNTSLDNVVANGVNILSVVIGVVAVVMIMVGGFRYITAGGDAGAISTAKKTIIYAMIGLVIVGLAQSLVHFVLHAATTAPTPTKGAPAK